MPAGAPRRVALIMKTITLALICGRLDTVSATSEQYTLVILTS